MESNNMIKTSSNDDTFKFHDDIEKFEICHDNQLKNIILEKSNEGFRTTQWGPMIWSIFHVLAAYIDQEPTPDKKKLLIWLLTQLRVLMFCMKCRESFSVFWSLLLHPRFPSRLSSVWFEKSSTSTSTLVTALHSMVSEKLGKDISVSVKDHVNRWHLVAQLPLTEVHWIHALIRWLLLVTLNLFPANKEDSVWRLRQETTLFRVLKQLGTFCQQVSTNKHHILQKFGEVWQQRIVPKYLRYDIWKSVSTSRRRLFLFICFLVSKTGPEFENLLSSPQTVATQLESMRVAPSS